MTTNRWTICCLLSVGAILALWGCEQPVPQYQGGAPTDFPVMISTDAPSYQAGDTISIRVVNQIGRPVTYHPCRWVLERDSDGAWQPVRDERLDTCKAEPRMVGPGQVLTYTFRSDPRSRRGQYRFRTTLQDLDGRTGQMVISNSFAITRESSD